MIDRDKLAKKTKAEILDSLDSAIAENDADHTRRLREQSKSILNLARGRSFDAEMSTLHARIAELERQLASAQDELRRTRGEFSTATSPTLPRGL